MYNCVRSMAHLAHHDDENTDAVIWSRMDAEAILAATAGLLTHLQDGSRAEHLTAAARSGRTWSERSALNSGVSNPAKVAVRAGREYRKLVGWLQDRVLNLRLRAEPRSR